MALSLNSGEAVNCSRFVHPPPSPFICPLALALAKTDVWEGHAGQTQATSSRMQNPFGFHYLSVTVLSGIPGYLVERDCYMRAARISDI